MSEAESRDLTAALIAAFNGSDWDALISMLAEDVVCDIPGLGREIGTDRLRWRLAGLARHFRLELADTAVMTAPGGLRTAAEFTLRGRYLATLDGFPPADQQAFQLPGGLFLELDDDGRIARLSAWFDPSRLRTALAAAPA
jgi:steroid delta-isomerase-like uncharacterized protein